MVRWLHMNVRMHIIFNASSMNSGGMNISLSVLLSMSSQQPQAGELQPRV